MSKRVVFVVGPTASGKTALGLRLAKTFGGEIVNADARQLYRDAPIGTGVPSGTWLNGVYHVEGIPHHLMAMSSPDEAWTVSRWQQVALQEINNICVRGRLPIVVGGTGLYIRALSEGYLFQGEPDLAVRERLLAISPEQRARQLQMCAPDIAQQIDLRNPHRVLRALERLQTSSVLPTRQPPDFSSLKLMPAISMEELKEKIKVRIQQQWRAGWLTEVQTLMQSGVSAASPLMQSIGFRAIAKACLEGNIDEARLKATVAHDTWQYARRQMTWFRKEPNVQQIFSEEDAFTRVGTFLSIPIK